MTDDLSITPIVPGNISGDDLGSALVFSRIASSNAKESLRSNASLGASSPSNLRVAHQPITPKNDTKRTLCALDQSLARLDAQSNVIRIDTFKVAFQLTHDAYVTEAEVCSAAEKLLGYLVASNFAGLKSMFRGET